MIMLFLLVLFNFFSLVKYFSTLLTVNLVNRLQVGLQLGICLKHFMTIVTLEQVIHHV